MSRVVVTVAIDDAGVGPQGVKEAVVMRLEPLGGVRVLRVEVQEPQQLGFVPNSGTGRRGRYGR